MSARPLKYSATAILAGVLLSSCIVVDLNGFQLETVKGSGKNKEAANKDMMAADKPVRDVSYRLRSRAK